MRYLLILLALVGNLFAYSYSAFSYSSGKSNLYLVPFLYGMNIDGTNFGGGDICLQYGITDKLDVIADVNDFFGAGTNTIGWYGMIRYDFGANNIFGIKANNYNVSPQIHFIREWDHFALQYNAAMQLSYDYMENPAYFGIVCPVVKFTDRFDLYAEFNPVYATQDQDCVMGAFRDQGFNFDLTIGTGIKIKDILMSLAVPVYNVNSNPIPSIGMWMLFKLYPIAK